MPSPGLFSDFTKAVDDILNENYVENTKLSIKSANALSPFTINTNGVRSDSGAVTGDVQAKFKHNSGVNMSCKIDHNANVKAEAAYAVSSALKMTGNVVLDQNKGNSGKFSAEFKNDMLTSTAGVDTANALSVFGSMCAGSNGFAVGADANYDTGAGKLKSYNAGLKYTPSSSLSLAGLYKSNGNCSIAVNHKFSDKYSVATTVDHNRKTKENCGTIGGEYQVDKDEKIAVKANSAGRVFGSYQFKATHICAVNLSASVNSRNLSAGEGHKLGMSVTFEDSN